MDYPGVDRVARELSSFSIPPGADSPWIQTFSGLAFDLAAPDPSMVAIKDIAQALSNQCRFAGHVKRFYSVAEHSLYVSRVVPRDLARLALLHDAAEAYSQDVTRPLKALIPDFRALEHRIWGAVRLRLGLPETLPGEIKEADLRMLATEAEYLLSSPPRPWGLSARPYALSEIGLDRPGQFGLPPREAHRRFLERFAELAG